MKNKMKSKSSNKLSAFARRYILQYLFALIIPVVAATGLALLADWLAGFRIWYYHEKSYKILHWFKENIFVIILLAAVIIGVFVTVVFMRRLLRYLDDVINASKGLMEPSDAPIELPPDIAEAQLELNLVRENALRNAALAREAEQRKNDMIVYLAHDLKTPLTSVIGYLTLLRDEPDIPAESREKYTSVALERSQRLEELINEFFDITRFSLTTLTLDTRRIDLSLLLNQTISEFSPIFAENFLTANVDIQSNVYLVCDPDKLERVFDNILKNAVNYSYENSEIEFAMTADDSAVTVTCKNRGRTIPKEKLDRIFEQFFRVDTARQSKTGGAGLGLAIAKEIVTLHGGAISAASDDEVIEFTVVIPRK